MLALDFTLSVHYTELSLAVLMVTKNGCQPIWRDSSQHFSVSKTAYKKFVGQGHLRQRLCGCQLATTSQCDRHIVFDYCDPYNYL